MKQRTAKWMWNGACTEPVGSDAKKCTAFGNMALALDIPVFIKINWEDDWMRVAKFLRVWANAIEGIE